jgi:uncharacterized protein YkuJ
MLSLGAINKVNGEYVYPKIANKKDAYICPECNKDLILCQGTKRVHHFRHKVDCIDPCRHYSHPTETQIHKDAKLLLKNLLDRKIPISFIRNCDCCKKNEEFEIPEISEGSNIQLEYRFEHNGVKVADVAYLEDGEILCIFEICNTHKTCSENRPEPWFEIDALTLIKLANDSGFTALQIPCIRRETCEGCIELENKNFVSFEVKKFASKLLIALIKKNDNDEDPFYFREYDGTMDLNNNWSDMEPHDKCFYNVGNVKPDIVMYDKCTERYYIYLNKPSFTDTQIEEYRDHGIGVYFVSIDWILQQDLPTKIEYFRIIDPEIKPISSFFYTIKPVTSSNNRRRITSSSGINDDDCVYLKVDFSKKDLIKEYGGKWNNEHKLWFIAKLVYIKKQNYIDKFIGERIEWVRYYDCEHCLDMRFFAGEKCWFC